MLQKNMTSICSNSNSKKVRARKKGESRNKRQALGWSEHVTPPLWEGEPALWITQRQKTVPESTPSGVGTPNRQVLREVAS